MAELEGALSDVPDQVEELAQLKSALGVGDVEQMTTVVAAVVEDRDTAVERIVEIDRGSDDGVAVDMPVVTGQGLVGYVVEVLSGHRSVVRLITDGRVSVAVTVRRGRVGKGSRRGQARDSH
ncbi:MAG: rod shape-determining protein MreC [Acidimicrobiales bacterium]